MEQSKVLLNPAPRIQQFVDSHDGLTINLNAYYNIEKDVVQEAKLKDDINVLHNKIIRSLAHHWDDSVPFSAELATHREHFNSIHKAVPDVSGIDHMFDDKGWDQYCSKSGYDDHHYGCDEYEIIAADIMRQFYQKDSGVMLILGDDTVIHNGRSSVIERIRKWLNRTIYSSKNISYMAHVRYYGGWHAMIITDPRAAADYLIDLPDIAEAMNLDPMNEVNVLITNMFNTFSGKMNSFYIAMMEHLLTYEDGEHQYELNELINIAEALPPSELDIQKLAVPTKTKLTPIQFAQQVFATFGYIMDLNGIPTNAKFPKLSRVIENVGALCGTGSDLQSYIEQIVEYCMTHGNTITVKSTVSGIRREGTDEK